MTVPGARAGQLDVLVAHLNRFCAPSVMAHQMGGGSRVASKQDQAEQTDSNV